MTQSRRSDGWIHVQHELPATGQKVLVCYLGELAIGFRHSFFPETGFHDWMIYRAGHSAVVPYPRFHPRWWMPLPTMPEERPEEATAEISSHGEGLVRWRGSVRDLCTDLVALLTPDQRVSLGKLLIGPGRLLNRVRAAVESCPHCSSPDGHCPHHRPGWVNPGLSAPRVESREPSPPPVPLPMLLWCPDCNSRHVDVGEFEHKRHHTHACQVCGHVWRPAIFDTKGVQFLPGFKNGEEADSKQQTANSPEKKLDVGRALVALSRIRRLAETFSDGQLDANEVLRLCKSTGVAAGDGFLAVDSLEAGRRIMNPAMSALLRVREVIDRVMGDDSATNGETRIAEELDYFVPARGEL